MRKRIEPSYIITFILTISGIGLLTYWGWPYLSILKDPVSARELIEQSGSKGPFIFILMQVAQVFLAPIPGQVVALVGGYLFGPVWGSIYMMIGALIGFSLILLFSRKLGRPFVELFVSKSMLDKFDRFTDGAGPFVFFLIFLLPGFPDDIVSYIAGLTKIRIRTLLLITVGGRMPGYVLLNITGDGLAAGNLHLVVLLGIGLILLAATAFWQRAWLRRFVVHADRWTFVKETWSASRRSITLAAIGLVLLGVLLYMTVILAWPYLHFLSFSIS